MPPNQDDIEVIFRRESIASVIINSIGAFMTFFYLNVIDPVPTAEKSIRPFESFTSFIFIAILATTLFVGISWGNRLKRNLIKWHSRITIGEVDIVDVPIKIKRDALNFSFYAAGIASIMWLSASMIAAYVTESSRIFFNLLWWGGFISVTLLYFVDDMLWRPIIPTFFPNGELSKVKAFHLPVFWKLLIAFFFIGILPPTLLARLTWQRVSTLFIGQNSENLLENLLILQVFILGASIAASIILAFFITRGITTPIKILREAMGYIQKGDLDTKVKVSTGDELGYLGEHFNQMIAELKQQEVLRNTNVQLREQLEKIRFLEATVREQTKEAERHRLARDLHDSMTQSLHSLTLSAETAQQLHRENQTEKMDAALAMLGDSARQALREMRLLCYELQLTSEEDVNLFEILETRLESVEQRMGIKTELKIENPGAIPKGCQREIFYIITEALNNALKHSFADRVSVSILGSPYQVTVSVQDNGRGFDPEKIKRSGMGLKNITERAVRLGATLKIEAGLGAGTTILLALDLYPTGNIGLPCQD